MLTVVTFSEYHYKEPIFRRVGVILPKVSAVSLRFNGITKLKSSRIEEHIYRVYEGVLGHVQLVLKFFANSRVVCLRFSLAIVYRRSVLTEGNFREKLPNRNWRNHH